MRKYFDRRNAFLAFVAVVLLIVAWYASASVRGRWAARYDVGRGHYEVLGYGLPCCEVQEYKRILRERYGIEHRQIALCLVSESERSYADAYNSVAGPAIARKYGRDVLGESWTEARRAWQAKRRATLQGVSHSE